MSSILKLSVPTVVIVNVRVFVVPTMFPANGVAYTVVAFTNSDLTSATSAAITAFAAYTTAGGIANASNLTAAHTSYTSNKPTAAGWITADMTDVDGMTLTATYATAAASCCDIYRGYNHNSLEVRE